MMPQILSLKVLESGRSGELLYICFLDSLAMFLFNYLYYIQQRTHYNPLPRCHRLYQQSHDVLSLAPSDPSHLSIAGTLSTTVRNVCLVDPWTSPSLPLEPHIFALR